LTNAFVAVLAVTALLAALPQVVPAALQIVLFHEDGVFEWLAAGGWLLTALVALVRARPVSRLMISYALIFCLLGAREADLLGRLVSGGGKQVGRSAYYLGATGAPLSERILIVGLLAAAVLALVVGIGGTLRNLRRPVELSPRSLHLLLLGGAVLAFSQLCEELLDLSYGLGGEEGKALARSFWALEEGLEAVAPLLMAVALAPSHWFSGRHGR